MDILKKVKLKIDQKYRKQKFAKVLINGIKPEILKSIGYVKSHIALQKKEINVEKEMWAERLSRVNDLYKKLNSYGYKNRKDYFDSVEGELDLDLDLIDLVGDINRSAIIPEAEENYKNKLDEYYEEIKASEKILSSLEKMAPFIAYANVQSVEEIELLFEENGCYYLLHMPSIIDIDKILSEHYYS